jgi:hypothetical protein
MPPGRSDHPVGMRDPVQNASEYTCADDGGNADENCQLAASTGNHAIAASKSADIVTWATDHGTHRSWFFCRANIVPTTSRKNANPSSLVIQLG